MKMVYSGLEGSGKSYLLAVKADELLKRNAKWFRQSGIARSIVSNEVFSDEFVAYARKQGIKIVYFTDLNELVEKQDVDIIIDELSVYFDARGWESLPLEVRLWLSQAHKNGIEIYGASQDFAQVDKAFRRLVNKLFFITKVLGSRRPSATRPPIKHIWGLCFRSRLNPVDYNEEKSKFKPISILPTPFLIRPKFCRIFNTRQAVAKPGSVPLHHRVRKCLDCGVEKVIHS